MIALLVQETAFHGYSRRDLTPARLGPVRVLWYHPLLCVWRTSGTVRLLIGRHPGVGQIRRESLGDAPTEALFPLTG